MAKLSADAYTITRQVVEIPRVTVMVAEYLQDQAVADNRTVTVYTTLPDAPVWPVIRPARIGGVMRNVAAGLDEAIVDFDVWAKRQVASLNTIETLAAWTRAQIFAMRGVRHRGLVVTKVEDSAGPAPRPEDDPTLDHLGFTVGLLVHPA